MIGSRSTVGDSMTASLPIEDEDGMPLRDRSRKADGKRQAICDDPALREMTCESHLLEVRGLHVRFAVEGRQVLRAVDGVDFSMKPGEILGLVGESGSGKTVLSLSLLKLIAAPGQVTGNCVLWRGRDLLKLGSTDMRQVRGKEIAMIFQNPQSSLSPVHTIGSQLEAVIRLHSKSSRKAAREESIRLLRLVRIPDAKKRINDYPNQFSVGMCQRIMIAMALSCRPKLLIADEPTASLDVTIQAQIMDLLLEIRERFQMAILLVSHDLGVIARMCDRIAVMYLGRIVEVAQANKLYESPKHPYTQALLQSVPVPDPNLKGKIARIEGDVPSPINIPSGCRFRSRCPKAFELCAQVDPQLKSVGSDNHLAACLLYESPQHAEQAVLTR
jgi:oligopeptide/dipeptide ABC transporter ATP-binding protein